MGRSLGEWCDGILRIEKPRDWYTDYLPSDATPALDMIIFGMKLVLAAQDIIDMEYEFMWQERPFLLTESEERIGREIVPRLQIMLQNNMVPAPRLDAASSQPVGELLDDENAIHSGQSIEAGTLQGPGSLPIEKSPRLRKMIMQCLRLQGYLNRRRTRSLQKPQE